ncbi:MAG: tetratricopeptide repeat protein [Rhodobacteraceae bacterium]|nr:tetratricopeptide repeat protein [Paracoccaceae bacterium]
MPIRRNIGPITLCVVLLLAVPGWARAEDGQPARLADIRYALNSLYFTLQGLRLELLQSSRDLQPVRSADDSIVQRIDGLEAELRSYIDRIENLEFRINAVAAEGIYSIRALRAEIDRIEDEARIGTRSGDPDSSLMSGDTDPGSLPLPEAAASRAPLPAPNETMVMLPETQSPVPPSGAAPGVGSTRLIPEIGPEGAIPVLGMDQYSRAVEHYDAEDYLLAIDALTTFLSGFPQSPYVSRAQFYLAESHAAMGMHEDARKSYMASLLADRGGALTPTVMLRLGQMLLNADKSAQACRLLQTLIEQYPAHTNARIAGTLMNRSSCGG